VLAIVNEAPLFPAVRKVGCGSRCHRLKSSDSLGNIATGIICIIFRLVQFMAWRHPYVLEASCHMAFCPAVAIENFNSVEGGSVCVPMAPRVSPSVHHGL